MKLLDTIQMLFQRIH